MNLTPPKKGFKKEKCDCKILRSFFASLAVKVIHYCKKAICDGVGVAHFETCTSR